MKPADTRTAVGAQRAAGARPATRVRGSGRLGFALPLVLVGGFLLASLVISFHFVSASDTRSIARLTRAVQAGLLADLASDEVAEKVSSISYGQNAPKPAWVTQMFTDLAAARSGTPPFKVSGSAGITFALTDMPLTQAAAAKSIGVLTIKSVSAKLGPFTPVNIDPKLLYHDDKIYEDDKKDARAWDMRGPLAVEVAVAGQTTPFDFSQTFQRGQELVITDTSPPASEFALFSYLPPPTPEYALSDMTAGGTLEINPALNAEKSARVHIRGPLFILSEDAPGQPGKPHIATAPADKPPPVGSGNPPAYPDGQWTAGLSTVPGPRELQHTDGSTSAVDAALGGIKEAFLGATEGMQPRRPQNEVSETVLKVKPGKSIPVTVTINVTVPIPFFEDRVINDQRTLNFTLPAINWKMREESLVLSNNFGADNATFETIDRDVVGYYPPGAYLYGPLAPGKNKFKLMKTAPALVSRPCYTGVRVPLTGEPARWTMAAPAITGEGDLVTTEPVPRSGQPAGANAGLIGVYGVALFESKTLAAMPVLDLTLWMMQKFIDTSLPSFPEIIKRVATENKATAADQTLANLGISKSIQFIIRRFRLDAKLQFPTLPASLDASDLRQKLTDKQALVAPYGGWFHTAAFWDDPNIAPVVAACQAALREKQIKNKTSDETLDVLLQKGDQPDFTPDFAAVDPDWPVGSMPGGDTPAKKFRDLLCGEYNGKLLNAVLGAAGKAGGVTAFDALLALAKEPKGIAEPALKGGKRPKGALGDYLAPAAAQADFAALANDYPSGFFPSKYRDWDRAITRKYATMEALLNAETKNGALDLRGVVLVEKMSYTKGFTYRGRGIIVCTSEGNDVAELGGKVGPAADDATALLTLVHRVGPTALKTPKPPQLKLGEEFTGAVYSDSGVKPSGTTTIFGNLSCGLLFKGATGTGDTLKVTYLEPRMACPPDKLADRWTVEMTGEVSSTQPPP